MARHWKIVIAILAVLAFVGLLYFPSLLRSVLRLRRASTTEEQAQREITRQPLATPTDAPEKAQLFWASPASEEMLQPVSVDLPLSADPAERAKQLIAALITQVPSPPQRTLPADTELLQFYVLPDGSAIADFSENLSAQMPSGILSEQMAVESIVNTLAANVTGIARLKILIHGQEADTLAGHLDLTGFFPVVPADTLAAPVENGASQVPVPAPAKPPAPTPPLSPAPVSPGH